MSAGKGDKPRPVNVAKYNENYDQISWSSKKETKEKSGNKFRKKY